MTLDDILVEIKQAETIVIMAHETPDGDAVGSMLSMNLALKKMGKKVDVIVKEFPRTFAFLPEANTVKTTSDVETYDLAISLDCADLKRLVGREYFKKAKQGKENVSNVVNSLDDYSQVNIFAVQYIIYKEQ